MPFRYRVIDDGDILLVRAVGEADVLDWFRLNRDKPAEVTPHRCGLLIDLRKRTNLPSTPSVRAIGEGMRRQLRFAAVAVVAREGTQLGLARMVALAVDGNGRPLATFSALGEARSWLRSQVGGGASRVDRDRGAR